MIDVLATDFFIEGIDREQSFFCGIPSFEFEVLGHPITDPIASKMFTDRRSMIFRVEDGGYPELGNNKSGLVMDSKILPKRRRVSAVRDFPIAFRQHREQSDSHKKTPTHRDDPPDAFKKSHADFMTTRNKAVSVGDIWTHDPSLHGLETVYPTAEEKVASVTRPAIMEASDWSEEAKDDIPLANEDHDSIEVSRQTDAANKYESKADRRTDNDVVHAQSEFSKSIKQDRARVRACSPLNHKNTCMRKHRKVSAIRDFPVAFELTEKTGNRCDIPSEKGQEQVNPTVSLEQEEGKRPQGQHLSIKEVQHGEIVLALMAPSRCPWNIKKFRGSTSKKGNQSGKGKPPSNI